MDGELGLLEEFQDASHSFSADFPGAELFTQAWLLEVEEVQALLSDLLIGIFEGCLELRHYPTVLGVLDLVQHLVPVGVRLLQDAHLIIGVSDLHHPQETLRLGLTVNKNNHD